MSKSHDRHQRKLSLCRFGKNYTIYDIPIVDGNEDYAIYDTPVVDGNESGKASTVKVAMMPPKPPTAAV